MVEIEIESLFINACITIFSLAILILSFVSYKKYKNIKLVFITTAFFIFFMKGIIISLGLFFIEFSILTKSTYFGLFDVLILVFVFVSTLK